MPFQYTSDERNEQLFKFYSDPSNNPKGTLYQPEDYSGLFLKDYFDIIEHFKAPIHPCLAPLIPIEIILHDEEDESQVVDKKGSKKGGKPSKGGKSDKSSKGQVLENEPPADLVCFKRRLPAEFTFPPCQTLSFSGWYLDQMTMYAVNCALAKANDVTKICIGILPANDDIFRDFMDSIIANRLKVIIQSCKNLPDSDTSQTSGKGKGKPSKGKKDDKKDVSSSTSTQIGLASSLQDIISNPTEQRLELATSFLNTKQCVMEIEFKHLTIKQNTMENIIKLLVSPMLFGYDIPHWRLFAFDHCDLDGTDESPDDTDLKISQNVITDQEREKILPAIEFVNECIRISPLKKALHDLDISLEDCPKHGAKILYNPKAKAMTAKPSSDDSSHSNSLSLPTGLTDSSDCLLASGLRVPSIRLFVRYLMRPMAQRISSLRITGAKDTTILNIASAFSYLLPFPVISNVRLYLDTVLEYIKHCHHSLDMADPTQQIKSNKNQSMYGDIPFFRFISVDSLDLSYAKASTETIDILTESLSGLPIYGSVTSNKIFDHNETVAEEDVEYLVKAMEVHTPKNLARLIKIFEEGFDEVCFKILEARIESEVAKKKEKWETLAKEESSGGKGKGGGKAGAGKSAGKAAAKTGKGGKSQDSASYAPPCQEYIIDEDKLASRTLEMVTKEIRDTVIREMCNEIFPWWRQWKVSAWNEGSWEWKELAAGKTLSSDGDGSTVDSMIVKSESGDLTHRGQTTDRDSAQSSGRRDSLSKKTEWVGKDKSEIMDLAKNIRSLASTRASIQSSQASSFREPDENDPIASARPLPVPISSSTLTDIALRERIPSPSFPMFLGSTSLLFLSLCDIELSPVSIFHLFNLFSSNDRLALVISSPSSFSRSKVKKLKERDFGGKQREEARKKREEKERKEAVAFEEVRRAEMEWERMDGEDTEAKERRAKTRDEEMIVEFEDVYRVIGDESISEDSQDRRGEGDQNGTSSKQSHSSILAQRLKKRRKKHAKRTNIDDDLPSVIPLPSLPMPPLGLFERIQLSTVEPLRELAIRRMQGLLSKLETDEKPELEE
ncbi:hypothetical protein ADUPG1_010350 [Aduncisulcus paluster]|uniref:Uncharacterized protein n=1 Tax=Aduncisulcus paluster TaxID=2918883 RepID=A0ABQ5JRR1_9EUKA|nr:hypothetical protein ADUPG1_010350 [Aduncisulcus paluster]